MRIFLTGVGGFIGSHVAEELLQKGDTVVGIDNFDDYYSPDQKRRNADAISARFGSDRFQLIQGDIRDERTVASVFRSNSFDAVTHLAAMPGIGPSLKRPALYYDVNLNGTISLLEAVKTVDPLPNFVFASTSSIYGNTERIPFVEDDPSDKPLAPYPASKRACELLGYTYHHVYGLDFTALRLFTVYGPRNRPDMMAYKVADNIQHGREVLVYNDGKMHRDWTYVGDIAKGIAAAVGVRLGYEIVNLGRGEPVLLLDFVNHIERLLGKTAHVVSAPIPPTEMTYTYADVSKAAQLFNYRPTVSVEEGLAAFLDWYKEQGVSHQP